MDEWRLLDTGILPAAQNMALDDILLECSAESNTPSTLRFLQFNPAAVLVGYHQSVEQEVRTEFCRRKGVDINRRITGGGSILFTPSCLGWEIIADKSTHGISELRNDLERLARLVCNGAVEGLKNLGVEAEFRAKNDIEVGGRKISGTGGTQRGDSFLYQGTLLVDFDVELMLRALRIPVEKLADKEVDSVKERVTCLKWELGYVPQIEEIKRALVAGFEKVLGTKIVPGGLLAEERSLFDERIQYFESDEWVNLVQRPENTGGMVNAMKKTPGGLVRVSLALDVPGNFIVSSFITGDFQMFPQRAVMDLEARLKNLSADKESIYQVVEEFFGETGARAHGVEPEDFAGLIVEAVKKTAFTDYGISLQDSNHLMAVNFMPDKLDRQIFDYVLLPYCAKLVDCEYRWREGCSICGNCSTSDIYGMLVDMGVQVRTIQTFEHLIETIEEFKKKGARGYIGSCCEAFYSKHHADFIDTGVPALLVDVDDSTCYDLGEEQEAYVGQFEGQTNLKVELLSHIIQTLWERGILRGGGQ
ncbi:MAG: lipoate--protein ligase family protein [Candidatus Thorarchaeota archaeon]|nr:MAG: lipoate--protein ligase [Candidatus Thorarchaeota archaeon]RLI57697.1 MAG: lipoate--protein ligase [Candidatus Thorarchaeota archaeon]